jgi:hypothetical protein
VNERISTIKERFRQELSPIEQEKREILWQLGLIYSGFAPGDILMDERGRKARVISVIADGAWSKSFTMKGVNIRKDGTDGETREMYKWQKWRKATVTAA